ncbi:MAG: ATP-binding cassette domain-containing protein [Desulfatiglandales bacterium]
METEAMGAGPDIILKAEGITKSFESKSGQVGRGKIKNTVLKGVSLQIPKGFTYGLVGESGCGKSTLCQIVVGLLRPEEGRVYFHGKELSSLTRGERQRIQLIFQDPYSSLNPKLTVGHVLKEALLSRGIPKGMREERALEVLKKVGLNEEHYFCYPHELSGGQRQRVAIARALCVEPQFLILDEPVSALDLLIQAQIVDLLMSLKEQNGLSYLFVSHDLKLVAYFSDIIGVMHKGEIVEEGPAMEVYTNPRHPYTRELLNSVPKLPMSG